MPLFIFALYRYNFDIMEILLKIDGCLLEDHIEEINNLMDVCVVVNMQSMDKKTSGNYYNIFLNMIGFIQKSSIPIYKKEEIILGFCLYYYMLLF